MRRPLRPPRSSSGRLGLLLPIYNCRQLLERHVAVLRECLDLVDEVVIVDSDSEDGAAAFLTAQLPHPRLRILNHPRGLYASWNAGLALIRTERVLIATAGDQMSRDGLLHLLAVAETADADVAISPPRICDADGMPTPEREVWPIHQVLRWHPQTAPFEPTPAQLQRWTMHFAGLSAGMLGSSASNLYRTRMLQERPFPLDCGPAGDVAWGIRHLASLKTVLSPRPCADFVAHARPPRSDAFYEDIQRRLLAHALATCNMDLEGLATLVNRYRIKEARHHGRLRQCRQSIRAAWLLWPPAWADKFVRSHCRRRILELTQPRNVPDLFADFWNAYTRRLEAEPPRSYTDGPIPPVKLSHDHLVSLLSEIRQHPAAHGVAPMPECPVTDG